MNCLKFFGINDEIESMKTNNNVDHFSNKDIQMIQTYCTPIDIHHLLLLVTLKFAGSTFEKVFKHLFKTKGPANYKFCSKYEELSSIYISRSLLYVPACCTRPGIIFVVNKK